MEPVVKVRGLTVAYRQNDRWLEVVHGLDFDIARGEVFGLVGESGCGKSTVGLQLLGYRHSGMCTPAGSVEFRGTDLLKLARTELDKLRGDRIGFVPQNPTTALNPSIRVGAQVVETLKLHKRADSESEAVERAVGLFGLVGLPDPRSLLGRYPHELSGGQQQRVCIAMAVACDPDLIVLDEPTTGLDVTTQEQIIDLLVDLRARLGTAMLYVTHDLGLLAQIADRVGVMYAGHMVETALSAELFVAPRHPYTRGLIASVPRIDDEPERRGATPLQGMLRRSELPPGCPFTPRCPFAEEACAREPQHLEPAAPRHEVACRRWRAISDTVRRIEPVRDGRRRPAEAAPAVLSLDAVTLAYGSRRGLLGRLFPGKPFVAARDVSFSVAAGETFALVGESGSGKSTVARAVSGLLPPTAGLISLGGQPLAGSYRARTAEQRRQIQFIFQNPDASLNPRATTGTILQRPLDMFFGLGGAKAKPLIEAALAAVQLDSSYARRYSDQLSGGERQRVAIARALIAEPSLLLCDEILSALDVSVQSNIIELLRRLRRERQLSMLFISHDLAVVRTLADTVGVMFRGQMMETGRNELIFSPPYHPYTFSLLEAVPSIATVRRHAGGPISAPRPTPGAACAYAGRCPWQPGDECISIPPPWRHTQAGHAIRCHLGLDELKARAEAARPRTSSPHLSPSADRPVP